MSRLVTAAYDRRQDADAALSQLGQEIELSESAVVGRNAFGWPDLGGLELSASERAACEEKLEDAEFLLVARLAEGQPADRVVEILTNAAPAEERAAYASVPEPQPAPAPEPLPAPSPEPLPEPAADELVQLAPSQPAVVAEERIPLVEEALRIGTREVVRGNARVRSVGVEEPVRQEIELFSEQASVERRAVDRPISEEEVAAAGLLRERVIDVSEMREVAVVNKEAFVREEVIVRKNVERRVEEIHETLRRTEAVVDETGPDARGAAFAGGDPANGGGFSRS